MGKEKVIEKGGFKRFVGFGNSGTSIQTSIICKGRESSSKEIASPEFPEKRERLGLKAK